MAPCDFYLFEKMHLLMRGKRFEDEKAIKKACTAIQADVLVNDLKFSVDTVQISITSANDLIVNKINERTSYFFGSSFMMKSLVIMS